MNVVFVALNVFLGSRCRSGGRTQHRRSELVPQSLHRWVLKHDSWSVSEVTSIGPLFRNSSPVFWNSHSQVWCACLFEGYTLLALRDSVSPSLDLFICIWTCTGSLFLFLKSLQKDSSLLSISMNPQIFPPNDYSHIKWNDIACASQKMKRIR